MVLTSYHVGINFNFFKYLIAFRSVNNKWGGFFYETCYCFTYTGWPIFASISGVLWNLIHSCEKLFFRTVRADLWRYQLASIYGWTLCCSLIRAKRILRDLGKMQAGPSWAPPVPAITVSFLWACMWASSMGKWETFIPLLKVSCGHSCRGLHYWCGCSPEWKTAFLNKELKLTEQKTLWGQFSTLITEPSAFHRKAEEKPSYKTWQITKLSFFELVLEISLLFGEINNLLLTLLGNTAADHHLFLVFHF